MFNVHNWSKSNKSFEVLAEVFVVGVRDEPLDCSLGVANIDDLILLGGREDVFEVGREVVVGHFIEGVVPVFPVRGGVVEVGVGIAGSS